MLSKASDAGGAGSRKGEQRRIDFVVGIANMTFPGLMAVESGFANLTAAGMRTTNVLNQGMNVLNASMMAAGGFAALGLGMAIAEAAKFEKQMKVVQALIMDTADTPDLIKAKMADLTKSAKELAAKYGMAPTEVAKGLTVLGRAGVDTAGEMNTVLEAAVKLAKIEGITVQRASEMTVQMTTLFGGDYTRDAAKFAEILAHAANISTTSAEDIMTAMRNAGGAVTSVWKQTSVEEMYDNASQVSAMVATLSQQGVSGSMSGTAIKSFINYMAKDMPKSKKALSELGLTQDDLKDQEGNFKKFEDILDLFDSRLTSKFGSNKADWYSWFVRWGEPRQAQQYMKMMQENPEDRSIHTYDKYNQKMQEQYDMQERVNIVMSSAGESFNKMLSSMQVFMINVGSFLLPILNAVAGVLGFLASNGITSNLVSFIALVGGLVLVFGGLAAVLRWLAPAMGDFKHMLGLVSQGKFKEAAEFGVGKDEIEKRTENIKKEAKARKELDKEKRSQIDSDGKIKGEIVGFKSRAPGASPTDVTRRHIRSLTEKCDRVDKFNREKMGIGGKSQYPERFDKYDPDSACHDARGRFIEKRKGILKSESDLDFEENKVLSKKERTKRRRENLRERKAFISEVESLKKNGFSITDPRVTWGLLQGDLHNANAWDRASPGLLVGRKRLDLGDQTFLRRYFAGEDPSENMLGRKDNEKRKKELVNFAESLRSLQRMFKKKTIAERDFIDQVFNDEEEIERRAKKKRPGKKQSILDLFSDPNKMDTWLKGGRGSHQDRIKTSSEKSKELQEKKRKQRIDEHKWMKENLGDARTLYGNRINSAKEEYDNSIKWAEEEQKLGEAIAHGNKRELTASEKRMIAFERGVQKRQDFMKKMKRLPSSLKGAGKGIGGAIKGVGSSIGTAASGLMGMMGANPALLALEAIGAVAMIAAIPLLDIAAKQGQLDFMLSPYARLEKKLKTYGKHVDDLKKLQNNLKYSTEGLRKEQEKHAVGSAKYNEIQEKINSATATQDNLTKSLAAAESKYSREKERAKKVQLAWLDARDSRNQLEATYEFYRTEAEAQLNQEQLEKLEMTGDYAQVAAMPAYAEEQSRILDKYFASQIGIPTSLSKIKTNEQIKKGFDYEMEMRAASMGMKWDYDKQVAVADPAYEKKIKQPSAFGMLDAWLYTSWSGLQYEWARTQRELRMTGPFGAMLANSRESSYGLETNLINLLNPFGLTSVLSSLMTNGDNRDILGDQIINIIKPIFNLDGKTVEEAQSVLSGALKSLTPGTEVGLQVIEGLTGKDPTEG